jgi:hypothetical protein
VAKVERRISAKEIEEFNAGATRLSVAERDAVLERITFRSAMDARCDKDTARSLVKLLARQVRGQGITVDEIAADVAVVMLEGIRAKRSIAFKQCACQWFAGAASILERYDAEAVRQADPLGMTLGVRFRGSNYRNGAGDVFYIV